MYDLWKRLTYLRKPDCCACAAPLGKRASFLAKLPGPRSLIIPWSRVRVLPGLLSHSLADIRVLSFAHALPLRAGITWEYFTVCVDSWVRYRQSWAPPHRQPSQVGRYGRCHKHPNSLHLPTNRLADRTAHDWHQRSTWPKSSPGPNNATKSVDGIGGRVQAR
jgi:hypothetical protein